MKKGLMICLVVLIVLMLIAIATAVLFLGNDTDEEPGVTVATWKIGDTWMYEDTDLIEGESIESGFYVEDIDSYEGEEFYGIWDFTSIKLCHWTVDTDDLNPLRRYEFGDGDTYFEGLKEKRFDFPLKVDKDWSFTDGDNNSYHYKVNDRLNIRVPAGDFDSFEITKTNTKDDSIASRYYYSDSAGFIVKEIRYEDGKKVHEMKLKSFSSDEIKRMVSSEYLGGEKNVTLERWQWKVLNSNSWNYSDGDKWGIDQLNLRYSHNGVECVHNISGPSMPALDWMRNNTEVADKVLAWWDWGHAIRGYANWEPLAVAPSEDLIYAVANPWDLHDWAPEEVIIDISTALVGTPEETENIMDETGAKYILSDTRMYPYSHMNTGILYAPIKGAGKDRDDYWTIKGIDPDGYSISLEEAERKADEDPSYELRGKYITYGDALYNSMVYKSLFGYSELDAPSMREDRPRYPVMSGWNLTHFKMVYRTTYYSTKAEEENPNFPKDYEIMNLKDAQALFDDQGGHFLETPYIGTIILEYFKGASISGRVLDENGTPVPNVRVTVQDEYGIPHDSTYTTGGGAYDLILPPGSIELKVSTGGWSGETDDKISQQAALVESQLLNTTKMNITHDRANRISDDWMIEDYDLIVSGL